ncbi:MAG: hypothetical protein ACI8P9_001400 [Parasphingorhabdus sp.]|jgi:hypothetical protein
MVWSTSYAEAPTLEIALSANGHPLARLARSKDGKIRYQLNQDNILGMSLGLSPMALSNRINEVSAGSGIDFENLPVFSVTDIRNRWTDGKSTGLQLHWIIGNFQSNSADPSTNFYSDYAANYALFSTIGFSLKMNKRWTLGGALSFEQEIENDGISSFSGSGKQGAYLGVEFTY